MRNKWLTSGLLVLGISSAVMADPVPLRGLLDDVQQIRSNDTQINRQREARFTAELDQREQLLKESQLRLQAAEAEQTRLKAEFDANDTRLAGLEEALQQRSGQLGEVFGVAREVAAELRPLLQDSMTSAEYPERTGQLAFADSKRVPDLQDLQNLWYQLQLEMTASGEIARIKAPVTAGDGLSEVRDLLRIGTFTAATAEGEFLSWNTSQQLFSVLAKQPPAADQQAFVEYLNGTGSDLLIDPSRGQLLALLERMPGLSERIRQGGEVGYLILALGGIGLLVALWQMLMMTRSELRVRSQLNDPLNLNSGNPLGRVLLALNGTDDSLSQRELRVDEAILRELPAIERGQNIIKLLAAVAPLLGLLGTVVGMIATFQSITLFGTSDPKLMAGGISQALMTTVLGLVVAIPLLFCHSYLSSRSRRISQLLQEKSLGLLAESEIGEEPEALSHAA
ncbi:MotA/TolQ/ExbB proton channel family protein [Neptuniibacter halophilus]|uniref:MotA/TolQ/ExbB proton channel family protein n=1 Tax=Neptuniibacter halophilus TaxID=651666 RepID=UPI0025747357|nr:MotA/TolQ/ExbB proton channel family protein [Neptuniibacter halophilus]